MKFHSTRNKDFIVSARQAVLEGLAPDGGLYMPESIPRLPDSFFQELPRLSIAEIAKVAAAPLLGEDVPEHELHQIADSAFDFPAPLVKLDEHLSLLELFHGPTLAFKDFGARFMARLMSYFLRGEDREQFVLVATSGDTGSAVAHGFYKVDGIRVVLLYPKGQVSLLQEKQFTSLGENITALEVEGSFDDCQRLVKTAFVDTELRAAMQMASANSINIARLLPQSFYYFSAFAQLEQQDNVYFCIPSGNFGNVTAGLFAHQMGLPLKGLLAATNLNDVFPRYMQTGDYVPRPSVHTISNAMDVGNPSNFERMQEIFPEGTQQMSSLIHSARANEEQTKAALREVFDSYNYVIDPHGAVGYHICKAHHEANPDDQIVLFETAHPGKFREVVEEVTGQEVVLPERLAAVLEKEKLAQPMTPDFATFKELLLSFA